MIPVPFGWWPQQAALRRAQCPRCVKCGEIIDPQKDEDFDSKFPYDAERIMCWEDLLRGDDG